MSVSFRTTVSKPVTAFQVGRGGGNKPASADNKHTDTHGNTNANLRELVGASRSTASGSTPCDSFDLVNGAATFKCDDSNSKSGLTAQTLALASEFNAHINMSIDSYIDT